MSLFIKSIRITAVLIGLVFFVFVGSILPRMDTGLFASPDETAVSMFSKAWTPSGGFRLPVKIQGPSRNVVQLHPRSMVRQGDWIVPVGFLGMPFFVTLVGHLGSNAGLYLTLILILSSVVPFFYVLKKEMGAFTAISACVVFLSFPTVLLYVNRGYFPNLPVVALAIWGIWLLKVSSTFFLDKKKREWILCSTLGGFMIGSALLIRPIEAIWLLPWVVWAVLPEARGEGRGASFGTFVAFIFSRKHRTKKHESQISPLAPRPSLLVFLIPSISILILIATLSLWLSMKTYPFHGQIQSQPISGYQLSDYIPQQEQVTALLVVTRDIRTLIPIAFHPRVLWQNIRIFLFNGQGIWIGASLLGALYAWLHWKRKAVPFIMLSCWTIVSLFLMYGQTVYADNISGTATLGNSFLRYLIPLTPLIAIGCALSADALRRVSFRGLILAVSLIVFFCGYGTAYALNGDSESILATRKELARYTQIRKMTEVAIPMDAVILSERSDKIFASGSWTVVSPLPDEKALTILRDTEAPVYLFHRLIEKDEDIPSVISNVFIAITDPLVVLDNEGLYPIYGIPSQLE